MYNELKRFYDKNGHLGNTEQNKLSRAIVDFFISKDVKLDLILLENLASQIKKLFPNEAEDVYFEKEPHKRARGKLYYRYTNCVKRYIKPTIKSQNFIEKKISFLGNGIFIITYTYIN